MSTTSNSEVIVVQNLTKVYGKEYTIPGRESAKRFNKIGRKVIAVKNANFIVRKGEIYGFLGPNGSGKTTTIRCILDYLHIKTGSISVLGLDYHKDKIEIRKKIGYIPGDLALYDNFTGNELINFYGKFRSIDTKFLEELKQNFKVDLTLKIRNLSSGNRQQVGLIAALASKPELLLLDEPTSGLDPLMTARFHSVLKKLRVEGITIFLSSHDLAEVQSICDRVAIIKEGEIVLIEAISDLKRKFLQNVIVEFDSSNCPDSEFFDKFEFIINIQKINDYSFKLHIKENIDELIRLLTQFKISRLSVEDATLEEIFLHYYE